MQLGSISNCPHPSVHVNLPSMTRGRKKDLTIPPSRALTQQRDYRARKAQYIAELQARCIKAEDENLRLRRELELARAGHPGPSSMFSPETAQASSELMQQLGAASAALGRFQQLAFVDINRPPTQLSPINNVTGNLQPARFPPSPTPTSQPAVAPPPRFHSNYKRLFNEAFPRHPDSPTSYRSDTETPELPPLRLNNRDGIESRSPSSESECCGGMIDCEHLIEEDELAHDNLSISSERFQSNGSAGPYRAS